PSWTPTTLSRRSRTAATRVPISTTDLAGRNGATTSFGRQYRTVLKKNIPRKSSCQNWRTSSQSSQVITSLLAHKVRLKGEPGTLQFEVLLPKDDDTKVLSFEMYRDANAFEVHLNGPSLAQRK